MNWDVNLLGSETGAYGMARAFHRQYGVRSRIIGRLQLSATKYSHIVDPVIVPNLTEPKTFVDTLVSLGKRLKSENPETTQLLIPCGDDYSELLSRHASELRPYFAFNTVSQQLHDELAHKSSFYRYCEQYDLPHPATARITKQSFEDGASHQLPFGFPVALKPSDSVEYLSIDFPGRKKAYTIATQQELDDVIGKIFAAGYTSELICQDFIPGGAENMRVLNAYVDQHHRVRMMCLGKILLEDPTPYAIGNYAAIVPDKDDELCARIKQFLESIDYCGVANFDMKFDPRDGQIKLFEINLRQGRTNYFVTLNGHNLARFFVEDLVDDASFDGKVEMGDNGAMLLEVPSKTLRKYLTGEQKDQALKILKQGNWAWTLDYDQDHSLLRRLLLVHMANLTAKNYDTYMPQIIGEQH